MKKYVFAFLIWVMIIPIAILNGGFREYVLVNLGVLARPLSGIILSVCIFIVAYLLVPKIKNCVKRDYIIFGILWFILTNKHWCRGIYWTRCMSGVFWTRYSSISKKSRTYKRTDYFRRECMAWCECNSSRWCDHRSWQCDRCR